MRDKSNSIHLSGFFLKEGEVHKEYKEEIAKSWRHIHMKSRKDLGPREAVSLKLYLQWVQARAIQLKMPYSREAPIPDMFVKTTPPVLGDVEDLQLALVRMQQEKEAWENKCQNLEVSYRADLKERDDLIEILESHAVERQDDLFTSRAQSGPSCSLPDPSDWKEVTDRYAEENKQLKAQIARLTGKRQCVE